MILFSTNQRGMLRTSMMAFLIMLCCFTVFIFFIFHTIEKNSQVAIASYKEKQDKIKAEKDNIDVKVIQLQSLVGYFKGESEGEKRRSELETVGDIDTRDGDLMIEHLNKLNNKDPNNKDRGTRQYFELEESLFYPEVDDIDKNKLLTRNYSLNIENALYLFENRIIELHRQVAKVNNDITQIEKAKSLEEDGRKEIIRRLDDLHQALTEQKKVMDRNVKQLDDVLRALAGEEGTAEEEETVKKFKKILTEKETAEEGIKKLNELLAGMQKAFKDEKDDKKKQIRESQAKKYGKEAQSAQSETEKKRKVQFSPDEEKEDGSIVFADPRSQTVYIDLGQHPNVIRGLKFEVYRPAEKGTRDLKGNIEIQEVLQEVSRAVIISQNNLDPIVAGDVIVNAVFYREHPVYFVLVGDFTSVASRDKIRQMIEEIGGKVEEEVSAKTNFVVVGTDQLSHLEQDINYRYATNFGIALMTETDLMKYIGD